MERFEGLACQKHADKYSNGINIINLSSRTKMQAMGCPGCLDQEEDELKKFYISLHQFLQIQKLYKNIHSWDCQKQLQEINYIQKIINMIFEQIKEEILQKSRNRNLYQKYNKEAPKKQDILLEKQIKSEIKEFNGPYLDIKDKFKKKQKNQKIQNFIQHKYYRENNAINILEEIFKRVSEIFGIRKVENAKYSYILNNHTKSQNFYIGNRLDFNDQAFLERYLRESSVHAKKLSITYKNQKFEKLFNQITEKSPNLKFQNLEKIKLIGSKNQPILATSNAINIYRDLFYKTQRCQVIFPNQKRSISLTVKSKTVKY